MSHCKLNLDRNNIEQSVRDCVGDIGTVVREDISSQKVKYTVSFKDKGIPPALLFVDYNNDGTTTIEDSRGKNKEYAAKLANYVAAKTQVSLYDTNNLYFESFSDDQFSLFTDYLTDCRATYTTTSVSNGNKYAFSGEYGDILYVTRFNNGSVSLQGRPSITFNNAITILSDIYPSNVMLVGLVKYYKIDFTREELEKELLSICPNLTGQLSDDIIDSILPTLGLRRALPDGLTDYSYLCFPILRGLEGLIKTIFKNKGIALPAKKNFSGYLKYDEINHVASVEPEHITLFPDTKEKSRVETLYSLLCQQRHRIFHLDPFTPIIISKNDALDIVEVSLNTINDAY